MLYSFDDFTLDAEHYELRQAGKLVPVEPRVLDLVAYLVQHPGRTVTTEELLERLYPKQFAPVDRLTNAVAQARKVLGDTGQIQRYIQTVRRRGYRFVATVEICPEARVNDAVVAFPLAPTEEPAWDRVPDTASHLVPYGNALSIERGSVPHNLPLQLTSFIGRKYESAEVQRLLSTTRLLTLTGPAGCGKTRLALHMATNVVDTYPDGVWVIELAPLFDPMLIPHTVAAVLGVREEAHRPLLASLTDALRARQLLLVLDNCEHLVAACAALADALLRACPHLRSWRPVGKSWASPVKPPGVPRP